MKTSFSRRDFLGSTPVVCSAVALFGVRPALAHVDGSGTTEPSKKIISNTLPDEYPRQSAEQVKEMVGVSHFNLKRVKELVTLHPTLAKASWDWGFGDWETAIGAASHVGNTKIVEVLMKNGARPNIFTYAMLGQLDAVRATIEMNLGIERLPGPHGISLMSHARRGGDNAKKVVQYLTTINAPDDVQPGLDIPEKELTAIQGVFAFGKGNNEKFEVKPRKGRMEIRRTGGVPRRLTRVGEWEYHPAGAPAVRVRFGGFDDAIPQSLSVIDADLRVKADRLMD